MARSLYAKLLGARYPGLDARLRRLLEERRASGAFSVRRGTSVASRLLGWLLGLPLSGAAVPVMLAVVAHADGERWCRRFGDVAVITEQAATRDGLLVERFGPFEVRFRVEADATSIRFRDLSTTIVLGPLRVALPRWLAPRIEGIMRVDDGAASRVAISMNAPFAGLLMAYEGNVLPEEDMSPSGDFPGSS